MLVYPQGITQRSFLTDYWQQRPLVFRQGLPEAISVISDDELLNLATLETVESRLVHTANNSQDYDLIFGPVTAEELTELHAIDYWTILVQSVNLWHKPVADILRHFNFIPDWRLDDIMVSYAADQGSVGPHLDAYDVFLIQIGGQRRWRVAATEAEHECRVADCGLSLVADFESDLDIVLNPGDILYLPPDIAHHGISQGSGMTLSVGFRSPSLSQLAMMMTEEFVAREDYYRDPELADEQVVAGEISAMAINQAQQWYQQNQSDELVALAFGKLQTQPKQEPILSPLPEQPLTYLKSGGILHADPAGRIAWWQTNSQVHLFANGEHRPCSCSELALIKSLCELQAIDLQSLSAYIANNETSEILQFLEEVGYLGIE